MDIWPRLPGARPKKGEARLLSGIVPIAKEDAAERTKKTRVYKNRERTEPPHEIKFNSINIAGNYNLPAVNVYLYLPVDDL